MLMAHTLDREFNDYWKLLDAEQKGSVIRLIKSFLQPSSGADSKKYNTEIDEAMVRMDAGKYLNQEDIDKEAEHW